MELFATLVLGHLLADFPLQTNWVFRIKHRGWAGVLLHVSIHVVVTAVLLQNPLRYWPMLLTLGVVHFIADRLKPRFKFKWESVGYVVDQLIHLVTLLLLANWPGEVVGALPARLLYPAVLYALVPAVLMFFAIRASDLRPEDVALVELAPDRTEPPSRPARLILLSQIIGLPLLLGLTIFVIVRLAIAISG